MQNEKKNQLTKISKKKNPINLSKVAKPYEPDNSNEIA